MQRSFYYWKTVFDLSPTEQATLKQLAVQNLYVKLFDVTWNPAKSSAEPVAKSIFRQKIPAGIFITPVVFITQEPLQRLDSAGIKTMAHNIGNLLSELSTNNGLPLSNEVQLDCDWSAGTKNKYFYLLEQLQLHPFFQNKLASATIRLHQLKFLSQNGVPPVNKGLLMCYNMGNLRHAKTKNSIIEEEELKKYINTLENYPLPLDIALPIFEWYILFDRNQYKGLVRDFKASDETADQDRIDFGSDTTINGYTFKKGQWLRHERSHPEVIKKCAERISKKLKSKELTVILYHLDQNNLTKYDLHELESFYNSFR